MSILLVLLLLVLVVAAWTWPVNGDILRGFSYDEAHPYAGGQHRGIDIAGGDSSAVLAPVSGTVAFAGSTPGSGLTVTIRTDDGYSVTLTHLGSVDVSRGSTVGEGE